MENRERDQVSQRTTPTEAGQINRHVEEEKGRRHHTGTTAEFGQNIGESEHPRQEGGDMRNRNKDDMTNSNMENESTRRSGMGDMGSSSGRSGSGSSGSMGGGKGEMGSTGSTTNRRGSTGELGSTGSSEGRH